MFRPSQADACGWNPESEFEDVALPFQYDEFCVRVVPGQIFLRSLDWRESSLE